MTGRKISPLAAGLFVLLGISAYAGARLAAFQILADYVIPDILANAPAQPRQDHGSAMSSVSGWIDVTGVASQARNLALRIVLSETPADAAAIEGALSEIAEASPTTTAAWQALVEVRSVRDAPVESVLAAFRMSALTASHEGYFMVQRAIFGLEHWTDLPDGDRRTVIRDVTGSAAVGILGGGRRYRAILETKPDDERDDIRAALTTSGLAGQEVLQALGL